MGPDCSEWQSPERRAYLKPPPFTYIQPFSFLLVLKRRRIPSGHKLRATRPLIEKVQNRSRFISWQWHTRHTIFLGAIWRQTCTRVLLSPTIMPRMISTLVTSLTKRKSLRILLAHSRKVSMNTPSVSEKYPEWYDPPESTDVIDEKATARIERLLSSWRQSRRGRTRCFHRDEFSCGGEICGHYDEDKGECQYPVLPHEHRIASAFRWPYELEGCYQFESHH